MHVLVFMDESYGIKCDIYFVHMEIALLNPVSLRIKGKQGSLIINPTAKATEANGFILLGDAGIDRSALAPDSLVITGPGEYEFGGIKVTGIRNSSEAVYSIRVDRIEILAGDAKALEKDHAKLNEYNIVLLCSGDTVDPSFVTALATNVIIFYGDKAEENIKSLAKEGYRKESKYSTTVEKLPLEIEKILLQ